MYLGEVVTGIISCSGTSVPSLCEQRGNNLFTSLQIVNTLSHTPQDNINDMSSFCGEEVFFSVDTLSKIISYIPSIDVLNLALTCKRFGVSNNDELSVIKKSANILVKDIATEEQLAALPHYDGESKLADYHYLQLMREPLTFDQLVGAEYVNIEDKSCVTNSGSNDWRTAISNNVLRAGKHYALFTSLNEEKWLMVGVMRPGQANHNASDYPVEKSFYQHFSPRNSQDSNSVQCCMYYYYGHCHSSDWRNDERSRAGTAWEGMEPTTPGDELGMLLNLDKGTLSVYKNGRKLGVMKRGLEGEYCWVVSMYRRSQVTIKRGVVPS